MANVPPLQKIFFGPKEFFHSVAKEKDFLKPWLVFIVLGLIYFVIIQLISIIQGVLVSPEQAVEVVIGALFGLLVYSLLMLVSPFIGAGIIHLGVMILGVRGEFVNTFKVVCYSVLVACVYYILIMILMTPLALDASGNLMVIILLVPIVVVWITSIVHQFYVEIIGLSMYHKISKLRAFFSIIIIPVIILGVLAVFITLLMLLIFGLSSTGMFAAELPNMTPVNF